MVLWGVRLVHIAIGMRPIEGVWYSTAFKGLRWSGGGVYREEKKV